MSAACRRPGRRPGALLASAALLLPLLASGAGAASTSPPGESAPAVDPSPGGLGTDLAVSPPGTGVLPSMAAPGTGLVRLQVGAFDPLVQPGPVQAGVPRVEEHELTAGRAYPWLVQAEGQRYAEVVAAVADAGAELLDAVPDATYLVRATPAQRAALAASPAVRWSGLLQPAWKLPVEAPHRQALLALEGTQTYRVYGFRGTPEAAALAAALDALPGVAVVEDAAPVVDVEATAAQLPAIAALPGVQWVGVRPTFVPHNAEARWVTDTGVRDVRWATRDDRLTGAGQTAAVADTGVNYTYDLNGRAHAAFRDCADAEAPRTDAVGDCKLADYTQEAAGSTTDQLTTVVANGTRHRKMAAYFDIGSTGVSPRDDSAHGSHVAGSVNADYFGNGRADGHDGMAPASRLVFQAIGTATGGLRLPADDYQLWRQAYRPRDPASVPTTHTPGDYANYLPLEDARTHNNSYGAIFPVADEGSANALDRFVWDHEDMAIVFSAGNGGPGPATINSPSVAKNNLSSCASANGRQPMASIDSVASFSSHGPTGDGRFGPDVCTPGQIVISAKGGSSGDDHYLQGTSMSGPVLTGLVTLVRQYFWDGYGPAGGTGMGTGAPSADRRWNPSAALVKAVTVNGADRMRGRYSGDDGSRPQLDGQWPSSGQGFGLVNLRNSLYFPGAERGTWFKDVYRADAQAFGPGGGAMQEYKVKVEAGQPLDVTLAWTDAPTGAPAGTPSLINNLDLEVLGPGGTYRGNVFTTRTSPTAATGETPPGTGTPDNRNPLERVRIAAPAAGEYTIRVKGTQVLMGKQGFALAAAGRLSEPGGTPVQGRPLQVDVAGDPTVSDVVVEPISADTSRVRFRTSEPTTAVARLTGGAEPLDFADVSTPSNGSRFQTAYATGPIETSPDHADRPVLGTQHEILLYGLEAAVRYRVDLTATDLAGRTATATTSLASPGLAFQPLAKDIGQLSEGATDNVPSTLATGTGWRTGTQLYAGYSADAGILGAFMFRLPETVDPAAVQGAVVELTGGHVLASLYDDDPRLTLDLLPEDEEERWGTQNYTDIREAPAVARVRPESAVLRGGGEKRVFSFTCADLTTLRESLASAGGERRAAFRLDSTLVEGTSLPSADFGFNRRSKGPDLRPRLVLLTSPAGAGRSTTPCDASTPAPVISDVGIATGSTEDAVTVSWRTQVPSDSTVLFREKGATAWTQVASPARSTTHEVQVLGLDRAKRYEFGVRSTTCNGRTTTADNGGAGWDFFRAAFPPDELGTPTSETSYDFETDAQGWTTETVDHDPDLDVPPDTEWKREPPGHDSANGFHAEPYGDLNEALLIAPPIAASGSVVAVEFAERHDMEVPVDGATTTSDALQLEYSEDGGTTWVVAARYQESNESYPAFDERRVVFVRPPGDVLLRFNVVSDDNISSPPYQGAAVDQVKVLFYDVPVPTDDEELPLVGPVPPPSAGATSLGLASVRTRSTPTPADLAAGTSLCAPFDQAPGPISDLTEACPHGRVPRSGFTDVAGNTHEAAIECMRWWAVTQGVTADRYDPHVDLTRDRMASFIARLVEEAGATLPAGRNAFTDDDGTFHERNIDRIAAAGIVDGKGGGRYAPAELVRRDQMAKFLVNAYEYVSDQRLTASQDHFGDDEGNVHEANIDKAAEAGFTVGRNGGYDPGGAVRRDAMASFLARVVERLVREGTTPAR